MLLLERMPLRGSALQKAFLPLWPFAMELQLLFEFLNCRGSIGTEPPMWAPLHALPRKEAQTEGKHGGDEAFKLLPN